ncbi:MAG: phosphatase PAP2 family protein [Paludibacter sp.]|nr:phosphatase PAP2 family protein [Paludibacter sp.]
MRKFTIFILLSNIFLILSINVSAQNTELKILNSINGGDTEFLRGYSRVISNTTAAVGISVPIVLGVAAFVEKDEDLLKSAFCVGVSLCINTGMTYTLKQAVKRPRPAVAYPGYIIPFEEIHSYSMPSGHTSFAFATATALSLKNPKWYVIAPSYLWACSVGYSRMNLGVHYPTDVLAGALLGAGSAWLTYQFNDWLYDAINPKKTLKLNDYFL